MENLIVDLKKQLVAQRMELATNIKNSGMLTNFSK